jgi:hypothetical protein
LGSQRRVEEGNQSFSRSDYQERQEGAAISRCAFCFVEWWLRGIMKTIYLGKLGPMMISAKPNMFIGVAVLWAILAAVGYAVLHLTLIAAVAGGLIAAVIHLLLEVVHQTGHYLAGKQVGHPLKGVRFWWILGGSIYPSDEPELPAAMHIRRALGGPIMSFAATVISGIIAWLLLPVGGAIWYLGIFVFLDNLFFYTLGAFLPLPFLDGGALLHYWGKR